MGNVFKSNEIYKRLKNVSAENNPLRRVRGVYVVGYLKIPKYTVSGILISSVKNIPATVIDMYDTYKTTYSDTLGPAVYDITPPTAAVTTYTTDYKTTYSDILGPAVYDITPPVPTIVQYTKDYKTTYSDTLGPAVYDITPPSFTVERLTYANINTTPDSTLRIRSIISNYATISTI